MSENNEEKIFSPEEIEEMFNIAFLPKLQEFARRAKEQKFADQEVLFFGVNLNFQFPPLDNTLTYKNIEQNIRMQLQPVTQDDMDRWKKAEEEKNAENIQA